MAYLGLVPSEHSSGPSVRRGAITKAGNPHVRDCSPKPPGPIRAFRELGACTRIAKKPCPKWSVTSRGAHNYA
jgi:transposase